jgi:hypothetical protein
VLLLLTQDEVGLLLVSIRAGEVLIPLDEDFPHCVDVLAVFVFSIRIAAVERIV